MLAAGAFIAFGLALVLYRGIPDAQLVGVQTFLGPTFRIIQAGSDPTRATFTSGQHNTLIWTVPPGNSDIFPKETVALCTTPRFDEQCTLVAVVDNNGRASIYVPTTVPSGPQYVVMIGVDRSGRSILSATASVALHVLANGSPGTPSAAHRPITTSTPTASVPVPLPTTTTFQPYLQLYRLGQGSGDVGFALIGLPPHHVQCIEATINGVAVGRDFSSTVPPC